MQNIVLKITSYLSVTYSRPRPFLCWQVMPGSSTSYHHNYVSDLWETLNLVHSFHLLTALDLGD